MLIKFWLAVLKIIYFFGFINLKLIKLVRTIYFQIWNRNTLECIQVLTGHTGSVLCLQYDENIIISGSSDSTVRYSGYNTGHLFSFFIPILLNTDKII